MIKRISIIAAFVLAIACIFAGCGDDSASTPTVKTEETTKTETKKSSSSTVLDILSSIQDNESMPFTITEKAKTMLAENENLFLEGDNKDFDSNTDFTLEYKMLAKNIEKYGDKLMHLSQAYVVSISETPLGDGTTFSELQLSDEEGHSYYVLSMMSYDDVFEDDIVECYGLPIGETSFENVSGGTTLAIVMAGSSIKKM